VKDGKVLAAQGFGVRTLSDRAPVDGETLFEIAANSKAFTAAMLAMLVDEGRLNWDDPVTQHLPSYQLFDPYATREMTIRDLRQSQWPGRRRFAVAAIIHVQCGRNHPPAALHCAGHEFPQPLYL
jgi:hypothetical protein